MTPRQKNDLALQYCPTASQYQYPRKDTCEPILGHGRAASQTAGLFPLDNPLNVPHLSPSKRCDSLTGPSGPGDVWHTQGLSLPAEETLIYILLYLSPEDT